MLGCVYVFFFFLINVTGGGGGEIYRCRICIHSCLHLLGCFILRGGGGEGGAYHCNSFK